MAQVGLSRQTRNRIRRGGPGSVAAIAVSLAAASCAALTSSEMEYVANDDVLALAADALGYHVDPRRFVLTELDIRSDSAVFQYRGVEYSGDRAWVVRFSEKSTERDAIAMTDPYALLEVIAAGRRGFRVVEESAGEDDLVRYIRYEFDSIVEDDGAESLNGRGLVAVLRHVDNSRESPLVFHIKLDNHGDRDELTAEALEPFLRAASGLE